MHDLWYFIIYFQKLLFTENYFLIAVINLATRGPLFTCLVLICFVQKSFLTRNCFLTAEMN